MTTKFSIILLDFYDFIVVNTEPFSMAASGEWYTVAGAVAHACQRAACANSSYEYVQHSL